MASTQGIRAGRAFVELFADDSKLVRGLRRAEKRLKAFGDRIGRLGRRLARLGALAAAPLAISTKVFAGFDDQMRAVQAVIGATDAEFQRLTDTAKRLGRTTSYTAAQVAGAVLELGRAGLAPSEIDAAIASVLALARATGTELPLSAGIASNTLRAFGLAASDMTRVADVLTATANTSAQTLEDLAEAMKYAAPVADTYGLSLEETAKALGALANFGIKGSLAGNTLKNVMLQIADPGVQKRLARLGVTVTDAAGKLRGVGDILADVGRAAARLPQAKRLALYDELFGRRAIAGGAKLATSSFQRLDDAIDNAAGTAERTAKVMDSGIGGALRRLWSAIEGVAIAVGEALAPALSQLAERLSGAANWITRVIEQNRGLVVAVGQVVAAVLAGGVALVVLGAAVSAAGSAFGLLATAVTAAVAAFKALGVVLAAMLPPIGLVLAAVAALGAYLVYATGAGGKALAWLGRKFGRLAEIAGESFSAIGQALAAGDIALAAKVFWQALKLAWVEGTHQLRPVWEGFVFAFGSAWETGVHRVAKAWLNLTHYLKKVWNDFSTWHAKAVEGVGNYFARWLIDLDPDMTDEQKEYAKRQVDDMSDQRIRKLEAERKQKLKDLDTQHEQALQNADDLHRQKREQREQEFAERRGQAEGELRQARKAWREAIDAARQPGRGLAGDDALEGLDGPGDIIDRARRAAEGLGGLLAGQAAKIGAQGTFNAANVLGLQAGGAADRMASGIEKIEKNTRPLKDADGVTFI